MFARPRVYNVYIYIYCIAPGSYRFHRASVLFEVLMKIIIQSKQTYSIVNNVFCVKRVKRFNVYDYCIHVYMVTRIPFFDIHLVRCE